MAHIHFYLIKKKIGRPEHSLPFPLHPLRPITCNFLLKPPTPPPPHSGRHICITPNSVKITRSPVDYKRLLVQRRFIQKTSYLKISEKFP